MGPQSHDRCVCGLLAYCHYVYMVRFQLICRLCVVRVSDAEKQLSRSKCRLGIDLGGPKEPFWVRAWMPHMNGHSWEFWHIEKNCKA